MNIRCIASFVAAAAALTALPSPAAAAVEWHTRSRQTLAADTNRFEVVERTVRVDPTRTAIVICDMWDRHWCRGATERVAEMAPRMNGLVEEARRRGVLIIHAPSDTMKFYAETPQRRRAQQAPKAAAPADLGRWNSLDRAKEGPLPIDDSDGGCDENPPCATGGPWRSQIDALRIAPEDVVSDRGDEVYNVLEARGITTVIVMGVHTNMCVLGRPFSIRALVGLGKQVFLMRDLTDTMYNSRRRPWVSHFVGTDLVVNHIERYWCPTVTSADLLGGEPFGFRQDRRPKVAFVIGENEYRTWETLPAFAREVLAWRGLRPVLVMAGTHLSDFAFRDYAALGDADLILVSVRRRAAPRAMLDLLRARLDAGKPLIGIRTASHAFAPRADALAGQPELATWPAFDAEVLGGNYAGHHGTGPTTAVEAATEAATNPLLAGVPLDAFTSASSLYKTGPLKPDATAVLLGRIPGQPAQPIAWTRRHGAREARVFYTSLGGPSDFAEPRFQRLLLNAVLWGLGQPVPPAEAPLRSP
jgi:nicotinamidase-related amidase/type 1 glutamine amidotransferase